MYASTLFPVETFTFATFLQAEFGFFGVRIKILIQVPLTCGFLFKAGVLTFFIFFFCSRWLTD